MEFENGRVSMTIVGQALARSNTGIGTPPFVIVAFLFCLSAALQIDHMLQSIAKIENKEQAIRGTIKTSIPDKLPIPTVISPRPNTVFVTMRNKL
mmetsp:Transcript_20005/g.43513  ORF Transcript_20005/g.43513 Transcript_20005/m.43513 type:complete len:95 (-) Transcript_20005:396-680(-)